MNECKHSKAGKQFAEDNICESCGTPFAYIIGDLQRENKHLKKQLKKAEEDAKELHKCFREYKEDCYDNPYYKKINLEFIIKVDQELPELIKFLLEKYKDGHYKRITEKE